MSEDLEFLELVSRLQQEQYDADEAEKVSPELEAIKSKLRLEMRNEGNPSLERLREIVASSDWKAVIAVGQIDLNKYIGTGISPGMLERIDSTRKELMGIVTGTQRMLEMIPRRISNLTREEIEPPRYREQKTGAQLISDDIKSAAGNLKDVSQRVENLKSLMGKLLASVPRKVETFVPTGRRVGQKPQNANPAFAVTDDRVIQV